MRGNLVLISAQLTTSKTNHSNVCVNLRHKCVMHALTHIEKPVSIWVISKYIKIYLYPKENGIRLKNFLLPHYFTDPIQNRFENSK